MTQTHRWGLLSSTLALSACGVWLAASLWTVDDHIPLVDDTPGAAATIKLDSPLPADAGREELAELRAVFQPGSETTRSASQISDSAILLEIASHHKGDEMWTATEAIGQSRCEQVFRQLSPTPASGERDFVLEGCLRAIAGSDRSRALELLAFVSAPELRQELADKIVFCLMSGNPPTTLAWLEDLPSPLVPREKMLSSLAWGVSNWGRADPAAAAAFATSLSFDLQAGLAVSETYTLWGYDHPLEAMAYAKALPEASPLKNPALLGALNGLAGQYPDQAKEFVEHQLGVNKEAGQMAAVAAARMPDGKSWALTLTDRSAQEAALGRCISSEMMESDDMWYYDNTTPQIVAWAETLTPGDARGYAWGRIAATWGTMAPDKAKYWLRSLPTGSDREEAIAAYDSAIMNFAEFEVSSGYPGRALDMLREKIFDPRASIGKMQTLLSDWAPKDKTSAAMWAASHGVPMPAVDRDAR